VAKPLDFLGIFRLLYREHAAFAHPMQLALSADIYVGWPVTLEHGDALYTSYAVTSFMNQPPDRTTCELVRWRLA
jgi:hypothetical protein